MKASTPHVKGSLRHSVLPTPEQLQAELEQVDASEPEGEGGHEL